MFVQGDRDPLDYYIERSIDTIRYQKRIGKGSIPLVWFSRHLYLHNDMEFYDRLIAALISRGILVQNGKRLMIGALPAPKKITRLTVAEVVNREFAEKSEAEKAAINRAGAMASKANRAREARNARRAGMMMRRVR